jgi:tRNA (cmo5U34)-methyltransferase
MKDTLFKQDNGHRYESFRFDANVVSVFDDMVERSVPGYETIQQLIATLANRLHQGLPIYDLGCSTGKTLESILAQADGPLTLVGIDSSRAMLDECQAKLAERVTGHTIHLVEQDLTRMEDLPHGKAGVVILCLVLQFLRPPERLGLLKRIFAGLQPGGCALLVEKTIQPDDVLNATFIDAYHAFKLTRGYSMLEIAKKREALENRLIPFYPQENLDLMRQAGFQSATTFFTWLNFQGYIARRTA